MRRPVAIADMLILNKYVFNQVSILQTITVPLILGWTSQAWRKALQLICFPWGSLSHTLNLEIQPGEFSSLQNIRAGNKTEYSHDRKK